MRGRDFTIGGPNSGAQPPSEIFGNAEGGRPPGGRPCGRPTNDCCMEMAWTGPLADDSTRLRPPAGTLSGRWGEGIA